MHVVVQGEAFAHHLYDVAASSHVLVGIEEGDVEFVGKLALDAPHIVLRRNGLQCSALRFHAIKRSDHEDGRIGQYFAKAFIVVSQLTLVLLGRITMKTSFNRGRFVYSELEYYQIRRKPAVSTFESGVRHRRHPRLMDAHAHDGAVAQTR